MLEGTTSVFQIVDIVADIHLALENARIVVKA